MSHTTGSPRDLVLASASGARADLLRRAGLVARQCPAALDERALWPALKADGADGMALADALAELKARRISESIRDAYVIGADQVIDCDGDWYGKPADLLEARAQLMALRGRAHRLVTSVCVFCGGERLWGHTASPQLTMRRFTDAFMDAYLAAVGPAAFESVGAYKMEGLGAQLFSHVEGDHTAILGLPLLPLLDFLRLHGFIPE